MPTILFTDIEGSTRLWEEHGDVMASALARHDQILEQAVAGAGGSVLKTTGDGLIAVFDEVTKGLSAAVDAQQALSAEGWGPTGPLRVRMGIHRGDTEIRHGDYFGPAMNRAARIMAAGHGGQVLVSAAVAAEGDLPPGVGLRDLGMHRLKDLTEPEHLYQVVHDLLRSEFPAPNTLDGRPNNIPQQATEFLGRGDELAAIHLMLDSPTTRLLTITGPGGAGKTRLGLQVAAEQLDRFPDGVFFVDLSEVRDPDAVFETVAQVLEIPLSRESDALKVVSSRLADSRMMLVLDNFEQVTEAAVGLSTLLQHAPDLRVVVTSRETLRVRAEKVFPVPALGLPHPRDPASLVAEAESVRLFIDRARAVRPDFAVTADNAATIAEICLRLDGLPLAIELAAARLNVFSPADLLDRLRQRLDVLGAGGRDLPDRQRTLWGAIGWSYELLHEAERETFELMSVFAGTGLPGLEAVAEEVLGPVDVIELLGSLVDKNLVRLIDTTGSPRFSMLLMIKEFAASRLADSPGRESQAQRFHALHFSGFVEARQERLRSVERQTALDEMESELENLRIAWRYFVERAELDHLLHMIEGMWALQESKGWYRAAIELADDALTVLDQAEPSPELAAEEMALRMSLARAMMAVRGYGVEVEDAFKRALEISETVGTPSQRFPVLRALATYYMGTGRMELCRDYGAQLLELGKSSGDDSMLIEGHYVYGVGATFSGDFETGIPHLERAIALHDPRMHDANRFRLGPNTGVVARTALGLTSWQRGSLERAVSYLGDAFDVARAIGRPYSLAYAIHHNALLALYRGRFEEAIQWSDRQAEVAEINDYPVWGTLALVNRGVALTCVGETEDGLAMSEAAVDLYQGLTAPPVFWPQLLALRALAHGQAGKPERGLDMIEEAITIVGPDDLNVSELLVLKGDLLSAVGANDSAMETFSLAAQIAGAGGLHLFELEALNRLVRLQRERGVTPEASDQLSVVYAGFTEGLDERDLVVARELLN